MNKKLIGLNRKYWNEMIEMAEKYNINPSKLVRVKNLITDRIITELVSECDVMGLFDDYVNHPYARIEFAKIVIENKPVFFLDVLYDKSGRKVRFNHLTTEFPHNIAIVAGLGDNGIFQYNRNVDISELTWNPPGKETLNYTEYPFLINIDPYDSLIGQIERLKKISFNQEELKMIEDKLNVVLSTDAILSPQEYRIIKDILNKINEIKS